MPTTSCKPGKKWSKHYSRQKDLEKHGKEHAKSSLHSCKNVNWLLKGKIARHLRRETEEGLSYL